MGVMNRTKEEIQIWHFQLPTPIVTCLRPWKPLSLSLHGKVATPVKSIVLRRVASRVGDETESAMDRKRNRTQLSIKQ